MFRLARLLLLVPLTYQLVVQAADAPSISPNEEAPPICVDGCSQRTLFNIVWGCVSTTIICAWAAIHPNIPPRERPFKATLRRLELMFWTIVAPEILPAWAFNQRLAAMTIRDLYNEAKGFEKETCGIWKSVKEWFSLSEMREAASPAWTLKHGHFVIMGGFHLVEPVEGNSTWPEATEQLEAASDGVVNVQPRRTSLEGTNANSDAEKGPAPPSGNKPEPEEGRVTILTLKILRELVKDREFNLRITEEEITQRSKGDVLSKVIFILQSTWFIVQCIARRVQGLSLTQLELTTLALASLNGITFIMWWDKPLGAQTLVRVYLKRKLTDAERNVEGRGPFRSELVAGVPKLFEGIVTTIHDIILCQSEANIFVAWLIRLPVAFVKLLLFPIIAFGFAISSTIGDLALGQSTSFPADATHVPTFYVPRHRYPKFLHALLLIALGSIFGAIHCAGWNFPFLTYAERKLWHIASLAVTIIPIAALPFAVIVLTILKLLLPILKFSVDVDGPLPTFIYFISTLTYASARLVLLGLALALLRHLPPSVYTAVDWTRFYPHVL